jgi:GT2 family glycosyltransferase
VKQISVILLNYNGLKHLKTFLPSVVQFTPDYLADVIVADNASTDGSIAWVKEAYPMVKTMEFEKNFGFADGYNIAIGRVKTQYVVMLNSDVEVTKGWLLPLLNYMEGHSKVVALQPKILQYNKKSHFEYAGACGGYMDIFGYPFCRGRLFDTVEEDKGQYDQPCKVFWATGACMMIRRVDFVDYGGFDENFFAHQEEIDLCWRINARGRQVAVVPQSVVYHLGGGTLSMQSAFKTYLNFRNNHLLLYKNLSLGRWMLLAFLRFFLDYLAVLAFVVRGKWADAKAVVKARFDFLRMKSKIRPLRKKNMEHTICPKIPLVYHGFLLFDYHFLRKRKFAQLRFKSKD